MSAGGPARRTPPARRHVIAVCGASEHNLKGIDVDIPRDALVVITGISGSGKSSLAFDTIYAEGQRRYVESLSAYARQFLERMQKPAVESIEGLPPTIAIEQRSGSANPRSTVATTTEIYDYLRLLFARAGDPHCPKCGKPIARQDAERIAERVNALPADARALVLAPVIRGRKGEHREIFRHLLAKGFVRARVDGEVVDLADPPKLHKNRRHTIEAVVDRIVVGRTPRGRLFESIEQALRIGDGLMRVATVGDDGGEDHPFSERFACPDCDVSLEELSPRMFSFNSPYGACPDCNGLGTKLEFDVDLVVPDTSLSLTGGAIKGWRRGGRRAAIYYNRVLRGFAQKFGADLDAPFRDLPKRIREILLYGTDAKGRKKDPYFEGVLPNLQRRFERTDRETVKHRLSRFLSERPCPGCDGARLRPASLAVTIGGINILELTRRTVAEADRFLARLKFGDERRLIVRPVLKEVRSRLRFLRDVGLDYLTLDRRSGTLSGGEAQRIRLATQVGSGIVGVCYVLDEPTIGLHARDGARLIDTLRRLRDVGNTVILVEHDPETVRAADHLIDIGPGAGEHGGRVVAQGTVDQVARVQDSLTGAFLRGDLGIEIPRSRRAGAGTAVTVRGASANNLRGIDVVFPLGVFTCVTGVSGSGKSTLVNEILRKGATRALQGSRERPGDHRGIGGLGEVDKVIAIDQSPIGRTPRSNTATYTGAFDEIRKLFTQATEAKIRGYGPGRFSFNVKGGRCEACEGQGTKRIEMHFLPDVYVVCEACRGTRYNTETLQVLYRGKSIADILAMPVEEAHRFFRNVPRLERVLRTLLDVGLGYITLGQPSTTLSGGEAQRIKLSSELGKRDTGRTLYIMDEPTTGLHVADIRNLLSVIARLTDVGNTFVVIEHHLDVIKSADWVIDLGPEGGDRGGDLVVAGPPETVADHPTSHTGAYLRKVLPALSVGPAPKGRARTAV